MSIRSEESCWSRSLQERISMERLSCSIWPRNSPFSESTFNSSDIQSCWLVFVAAEERKVCKGFFFIFIFFYFVDLEREVSVAEIDSKCKKHAHGCSWVEIDLETGENVRASVLVLLKLMTELRDRRDPFYVRSGLFPLFTAMRRQPKRARTLMVRESSLTVPMVADDRLSAKSDEYLFHSGSICSEVWCSSVPGIQRCAGLEHPIDDSSGVCGDTPLHVAAFLGSMEISRLLLRLGASPHLRNVIGQTPLHIAAEFGSPSLCELLIAHGADVASVDDTGMSVLFYAIASGRAVLVQYFWDALLKLKTDSSQFRREEDSAAVSSFLSKSLTQFRMEEALRRDESKPFGPPHVAVLFNCSGLFFREAQCLSLGVDGVMVAAASRGSMESLEYLVQVHGFREEEIVGSFVKACETGFTSVLELLWTIYKNVISHPEHMSRALVAAVSMTQIEATNWLLLREKSLFAHAVQHPGILIRAASSFSDSVVLNLCDIGLDVNVSDDRGMTPLLAAAAYGRHKSLHVLIDRHAQLFARDKNDYGALHYACANDSTSVLESLLDLGLNPNEMNRHGESPLMVAIGQGLESIVRSVLVHMARKPPRDPLGHLKLWPNGPFLQAVLELHQHEYVEQRVLKNIVAASERVVYALGTYMGLNVLALRHSAPVDTKRLALRISLCCHLRHRNILTMLGVFSDGASYTILFELPGKGPFGLLDEFVGPGMPWTPSAMIVLCRQLLNGLAELHREGAGKPPVLHRDLQLSSFVLNQKNGPMLLPLVSGAHLLAGSVSGVTGARGWRPPECHSGAAFEKKSDVFGFAAVLYELREGKFPFSECHFLDIPRKLLSRDRPRMSVSKSKEDEFLVSVIESCWAHNPEDRPSFSKLCRRFHEFPLEEGASQEALENVFQIMREKLAAGSEPAERPPPSSILFQGLVPSSQISQAALQIVHFDLGEEKIAVLSPSPDVIPASSMSEPSDLAGSTSSQATEDVSPVFGRLSPGLEKIGSSNNLSISSGGNSNSNNSSSSLGINGGGNSNNTSVAVSTSGSLNTVGNSNSNISGSSSSSSNNNNNNNNNFNYSNNNSNNSSSNTTQTPSSGASAGGGGSSSSSSNPVGGLFEATHDLSFLGGAATLSPVQLMRVKIESTEYFARSIPVSLVQSARRLQLCQMRVLDVAHMPSSAGARHRGANHVLRILLLVEAGGRIHSITHRYNYVLYDRILFMANERKIHWSPEQVRSMALQIALGLQFLCDADPPVHYCLSDKDVFIEEEADGMMRVMVGGFGAVCMLAGPTHADMLGQSGFVDGSLLSAGAHFFNTVTDRNHRLASESTDVFSFGMVLRTILSLRRPFDNDPNANDLVRQGVAPEPVSLSSGYSQLVDLCMSCINVNAKVRPSFAQIVQRLDKMTNLSGKVADKFKPKALKTLRLSISQVVEKRRK